MNFQFYMEKLISSPEFEKFKSENPDAYLCSGFFTIDKTGKDNRQHLDFYIPSLKKLVSIKLTEGIEIMPTDIQDNYTPEKMNDNYDFTFKEIEELVDYHVQKENIKNKIEKHLYSFQRKEGKDYLMGTIFLSNLGMLKISINVSEKKIETFEKKSFFDMLKIIKK